MKNATSWVNIDLDENPKKKSLEELFINEEIINSESESCSDIECNFINHSFHKNMINYDNNSNNNNITEPLIMEDFINYNIIENENQNNNKNENNNIKKKFNSSISYKNISHYFDSKKYYLSIFILFGTFGLSLINLYSKYILLEKKYEILTNNLIYMQCSIL